jgi:hypothetical protein
VGFTPGIQLIHRPQGGAADIEGCREVVAAAVEVVDVLDGHLESFRRLPSIRVSGNRDCHELDSNPAHIAEIIIYSVIGQLMLDGGDSDAG